MALSPVLTTAWYTLVRNTRRYVHDAQRGKPQTTENDRIPAGSILEFPETGDQEIWDGSDWIRAVERRDRQLDELLDKLEALETLGNLILDKL